MMCETCNTEMAYQYDVVERETMFVLWECECAQRYLERRPMKEKAVAAGTASASLELLLKA
jgi:hypothetical protein